MMEMDDVVGNLIKRAQISDHAIKSVNFHLVGNVGLTKFNQNLWDGRVRTKNNI